MKTVAKRQGRAAEVRGDTAKAGPRPSSGARGVSWDARDQSWRVFSCLRQGPPRHQPSTDYIDRRKRSRAAVISEGFDEP